MMVRGRVRIKSFCSPVLFCKIGWKSVGPVASSCGTMASNNTNCISGPFDSPGSAARQDVNFPGSTERAGLRGQEKSAGKNGPNGIRDAREKGLSPASSEALIGTSTQRLEYELSFIRSENLSHSQAGFIYLSAFSDSPTSINITGTLKIKGRLDVEKFSRAFNQVMDHHEVLRTCFLATSGSSQVMQHVKKNATPRLDCLQSTKEAADADIETTFDQIAKHEYSISTGDTLRATLISHGTHLHTLVIGYHNIVLDPASIGLIFADINLAYQSQPLPTDSATYMDYARQQIGDIEAGPSQREH